jgi:acetylornithine deacetylase
MQLAVAERGLMVLDCVAHGRAGHAARGEGDNAILHAMRDIAWLQSFQFPRVSEALGRVSMNVTAIHAGRLHNVIPDRCEFLVDVRSTDAYSNEEILAIVREHLSSDVAPRSLRLRATAIAPGHPLVAAGRALGREPYASPTTSNKALVPFPALKMGPGESPRSHTADEYVLLDEISEGIALYIALLERVLRGGESA